MGQNRKPEEQLKKHCLCVRWDDLTHKTISTLSWSRHMSCSEFIRSAVMDRLEKEGKEQQQQA